MSLFNWLRLHARKLLAVAEMELAGLEAILPQATDRAEPLADIVSGSKLIPRKPHASDLIPVGDESPRCPISAQGAVCDACDNCLQNRSRKEKKNTMEKYGHTHTHTCTLAHIPLQI